MIEIEIYAVHAPVCLCYIDACWSASMSLAWTRDAPFPPRAVTFLPGRHSQFTFQTRVFPQTELWAMLRKYR